MTIDSKSVSYYNNESKTWETINVGDMVKIKINEAYKSRYNSFYMSASYFSASSFDPKEEDKIGIVTNAYFNTGSYISVHNIKTNENSNYSLEWDKYLFEKINK